MNDDELKFPEWQVPLQEAILEPDSEKLTTKIQRLEVLLAERLEKLKQVSGSAEKEAIHSALSMLLVLKRERLGYPDWK